MAQNIVICSDGTGNSLSEQVSNVARLIHISISAGPGKSSSTTRESAPTRGTSTRSKVTRTRAAAGATRAHVLDPPISVSAAPWSPRRRPDSCGLGLRRNVKELYTALAQCYEDRDAAIYLFGFSRGAFTVRVLAGLLLRCGLLPKDTPNFDAAFEKAYGLYTPHQQDYEAVEPASSATSTCARRACTFSASGIRSSRMAASGRRASRTCATIRACEGPPRARARRAAFVVSSDELGRHRFRPAPWTTPALRDGEHRRRSGSAAVTRMSAAATRTTPRRGFRCGGC